VTLAGATLVVAAARWLRVCLRARVRPYVVLCRWFWLSHASRCCYLDVTNSVMLSEVRVTLMRLCRVAQTDWGIRRLAATATTLPR
jgi:hypothetical protein